MYTVIATAYKGGKDRRQWIIMELRRWGECWEECVFC